MFIEPKILSDRTQRVCLGGKVSVSDYVVSGVPQVSVLDPLLFYCTSPSSFTLLRTILWAVRMMVRSMQLFLDLFRVLKR